MSEAWKPLSPRRAHAFAAAADMSPPGLSIYTYRSRRGAREAVSMLRDLASLWPQVVRNRHRDHWLQQLRHHRHLHTQMVRLWRSERRAAA
jgi:hypothetical protein